MGRVGAPGHCAATPNSDERRTLWTRFPHVGERQGLPDHPRQGTPSHPAATTSAPSANIYTRRNLDKGGSGGNLHKAGTRKPPRGNEHTIPRAALIPPSLHKKTHGKNILRSSTPPVVFLRSSRRGGTEGAALTAEIFSRSRVNGYRAKTPTRNPAGRTGKGFIDKD